jgi:uncharacterized protein (TIGR04141 family)
MVADANAGATMPKFTKCNIYLLKEEIDDPVGAMTEKARYQYRKLKPQFPELDYEAYFRQGPTPPADWLESFQAHVAQEGVLLGSNPISYSGLIFFKDSGRYFALTFGHGRHALNPRHYECDFGYETVNRLLDENRISEMVSYSLDGSALRSLKQVYQGAKIVRFRQNSEIDDVRGLSGRPKDERFGKKLTGSTPFVLESECSLPEIKLICRDLLAVYKNTKAAGVWTNRLSRVRDVGLLEVLNKSLIQKLRSKNFSGVSVGPPALLVEEADRFGDYFLEDGVPFDDAFDLEAYLKGRKPSALLSKETLISLRIEERAQQGGARDVRWNLWQCIEATLDHANQTYYIRDAEWFRLDQNAVDTLNNFINCIERHALPPALTTDASEAAYSKRIALDEDMFVMDKHLARGEGFHHGVEVADVVSTDSMFFHLKPGVRSSTTSHLCNQGTHSAFQSRVNSTFQHACVEALRKQGVPETVISRFKSGDFEVVFGFITNNSGEPSQILPFMAKLALRDACMKLQQVGIKVRLAIIRKVPKTVRRPAERGLATVV